MLKRKNGFTLLESVIAMGILSLGALVIMKANRTSVRLVKTGEAKSDIIAITNQVRGILANPQACAQTLTGLNASSSVGAPVVISDSLGNPKFSSGNRYGKTLTLVSMSLDDSAPEVQTNPGGVGDTYLVMTFSRGRNTQSEQVQRSVRVWTNTNAAGNIVNCQTTVGGKNTVWQRSPSNLNNIYYSGGKIGIGTDTPQANLDINGALKLGNAVTCDANTRGTLRYNSGTDLIEYCSATGWQNLGGGGSLGTAHVYQNWYFGGARTSEQGSHTASNTTYLGECPANHVVNNAAVYAGASAQSDIVDGIGFTCAPLN